MNTRRVFQALPLPGRALERLERAGGEVQRRTRGLRVVRSEGMHLTLFFFGELGAEHLAEVEQAMDDPRLILPPIEASLGGLEQFPPRGNPRVLYCPVRRGAQEVGALYRLLREALVAVWGTTASGANLAGGEGSAARPSWDTPRPFTPHVTVARNRGAHVELAELQELFDFEQPMTLDRLVLFQSILKPEGAEYRPLKTLRLAGERKESHESR